MSQTQRKFFTSTPRKRTYLWDTGQGILKSQTKNLSDNVNTEASRFYRVALWSSENAECSSKKTKKTGTAAKKKQKKTECSNSQNLDKDKSLNAGTCDEGQQKTGDNLDDQVENKKPKETCHKKRDKYKLHVNKEIQKLFSQTFSHDKRKDPLHRQDDNSKKNQGRATEKSIHLDEKMLKASSHKESAVVNSYDNYANRNQRETCVSRNHDNTVKERNQKNYKRSSRDAGMNDKDKCEDDLFLKSSGQIGEDDIDTNGRRLKDKNNIGCLDTKEDDSSKNNEAGDIFDIWDLSQDSDKNGDNFSNRDSQTGQTRLQQLKKNRIKKNDSLNLSKNKNPKKNNKSCSQAKCSESIVKTRQVAHNSKTVPSSPHVDSSQVYDFPQSPNPGKSNANLGKSKAKVGKKSSKKKKDLKHDLAVDQILKVISKTKMEIESMKETILKKKTKHK